jgi:diaminopimelate decarboxylase
MPSEDRLPSIAHALRLAARRYGTPLYLTDLAAIEAAATTVRAAFPDPWLRAYSLKANDVPAVVAATCAHGFGANVVSRGEWWLARRAGIQNASITLEGVGKSDRDLREVVRAARDGSPLRWVAVESTEEVSALVRLAERAGLGGRGRRAIDVLLRLNPAVAPETVDGLAVGRGGSKFGMTETELTAVAERHAASRAVRMRGVHLHVGSQLGAVDAWRDGVRRALAVLGLVRGTIGSFDTLDVGGGFPVGPIGSAFPGPERFAQEMPGLLDAIPADRRPDRLAVEPGRSLVARSGWLVARVLHARERGGPLVVLDAGMTELIRPALYDAFHEVVALTSSGRALDPARSRRFSTSAGPDKLPTIVEGPICESTDALGQHDLPPLRRGDIVAIRDSGAYGASQSSAYNGRPRPPQVLLDADGRLVLARRRGTLASLA